METQEEKVSFRYKIHFEKGRFMEMEEEEVFISKDSKKDCSGFVSEKFEKEAGLKISSLH